MPVWYEGYRAGFKDGSFGGRKWLPFTPDSHPHDGELCLIVHSGTIIQISQYLNKDPKNPWDFKEPLKGHAGPTYPTVNVWYPIPGTFTKQTNDQHQEEPPETDSQG